MVDEKAHQLNA